MTTVKLRKIIRWLGAVLLLLFLLCLVVREINFTDRWQIKLTADHDSPLTSVLFPVDRVVQTDDSVWSIVKEPVYFTVRLPNRYERVTTRVVYQNNYCQTVKVGLEVGAVAKEQYQLKLLDDRDFNALNWPKMTSDNFTLWQKEARYANWQDWFDDLPQLENVAGYEVNSVPGFYLADYTDYRQALTREVNLTGNFSYYTYAQDSLDFTFSFSNSSPLNIQVYDSSGNLIFLEPAAGDDFSLHLADLRAGVYKVSVSGEDFTTQTIISPQKYLSFIGNVTLTAANPDVTTNGSYLILATTDFSGRQTAWVGGQTVAITEISSPYIVNQLSGLTTTKLSAGPIRLASNGLLALSAADFFNPLVNKVEIIKADSTWDYLIADYKIPTIKDEWSTNEVSFDLGEATIANGQLRFMIACPETSAAEPLLLRSIDLIFTKNSRGEGIMASLINYLKYWYRWGR